jgi:hypothetical protein
MNADASFSSSFSSGACLAPGALRQYLDGTLPRHDLHFVEKHLLDCDFCSQVIEDLDVSELAVPETARIAANVNARITEIIGAAPVPSLWVTYGNYLKAASALLLLLGSVLVYRYTSTSVPLPAPAPLGALTSSANTPIATGALPMKAPVADEFPIHRSSVSVASSLTTTPVESAASGNERGQDKAETPAPDAEKNVSPATPEVVVAPAVKKDEPAAEPAMEKENVSNLQIVSVKILQKMTKTSGSSRKAGRKGQLSVPTDKNTAYYLPEDMPAFPGGDEAMEEFLANAFKNPVKDKRTLSGKAVGVMFTVGSRGKISDVEITHSIGPELDVEIIRLISSMPQWIPGKHLVGDITCVLALTVR